MSGTRTVVLLAGLGALLTAPAYAAEYPEILEFGDSVTVHASDRVAGDVVVVGADVTIDGTVGGDVVVVGGDLTLGPDARIGGDAVPLGGRLTTGEGAGVTGRSVALGADVPGAEALASLGSLGDSAGVATSSTGNAAGLLAALPASALGAFLLVLGLVFQSAWPERSRNLRRTVEAAPGEALLVGTLASAGMLFLLLFLTITLVGVLVVPAVLFGAAAVWMIGMTGVCEAVGDRLPLPGALRSRAGSFAAGVFGLAVPLSFGFLGAPGLAVATVLVTAVGAMGVGATVLSRFGRAPFAGG